MTSRGTSDLCKPDNKRGLVLLGLRVFEDIRKGLDNLQEVFIISPNNSKIIPIISTS
jgi:hypothetical protein